MCPATTARLRFSSQETFHIRRKASWSSRPSRRISTPLGRSLSRRPPGACRRESWGDTRHAAGGGPVVGQEDQRPLPEPEGGDPCPEGVEGPDPRRTRNALVVGGVPVEVG